MLIERLRRAAAGASASRARDEPAEHLSATACSTGPWSRSLNENSASDGDIFPAMFREAKLGPLIGKRSWGGVVGITNRGPLLDGGIVNVPEFGFATRRRASGSIEGYGVDPDIDVENDPKSVIAGQRPAARARRRRGDEGPRDPRAAAGPPRRAGSDPEGHAADTARGVAYFTSRARADAVTRRASRIAGRTPKARPAAARESAAASEQRGQ